MVEAGYGYITRALLHTGGKLGQDHAIQELCGLVNLMAGPCALLERVGGHWFL
jgi:hypothetical protein